VPLQLLLVLLVPLVLPALLLIMSVLAVPLSLLLPVLLLTYFSKFTNLLQKKNERTIHPLSF
jgi:hypothetical protein